jgi:hypothetical protein
MFGVSARGNKDGVQKKLRLAFRTLGGVPNTSSCRRRLSACFSFSFLRLRLLSSPVISHTRITPISQFFGRYNGLSNPKIFTKESFLAKITSVDSKPLIQKSLVTHAPRVLRKRSKNDFVNIMIWPTSYSSNKTFQTLRIIHTWS